MVCTRKAPPRSDGRSWYEVILDFPQALHTNNTQCRSYILSSSILVYKHLSLCQCREWPHCSIYNIRYWTWRSFWGPRVQRDCSVCPNLSQLIFPQPDVISHFRQLDEKYSPAIKSYTIPNTLNSPPPKPIMFSPLWFKTFKLRLPPALDFRFPFNIVSTPLLHFPLICRWSSNAGTMTVVPYRVTPNRIPRTS